jgi:hypothetical protein
VLQGMIVMIKSGGSAAQITQTADTALLILD